MAQAFDSHDEILTAIRRVQAHLTKDYIVEDCDRPDDKTLGCVSCQAIGIRADLEMLARAVEDDLAVTPSSPPPSDNVENRLRFRSDEIGQKPMFC